MKRWPALSHEIPSAHCSSVYFSHATSSKTIFSLRHVFECKGNTFLSEIYKKIRVTPCNTSVYKFIQVAHKFLYKYGRLLFVFTHKKGNRQMPIPSYLDDFCYISYFTCWFQLDSDGSYNPFSCNTFHRSLPLDIPDISLSDTNSLTNSVICLGFIS